MVNSISVVLFIVLLAVAAFSAAMGSYYYSTLSESLKQKAENAISSFDYYRTEAEYYDNARAVVAGEPNSDKLEVEYLDADGQIRFSSSDLTAFRSPGTPDIAEAISMKRTKVWIGADPSTGEHIMAASSPLMIDGEVVGVMRYVTSLNKVDKQIIIIVAIALGLPLLRGVFNFCSSLANGVKALMYSASFFPEDEEEPEEPSRFELWLDRHLGSEKAASFFITVAVVLGIVFSVGLFILLPTALTGLVGLAVPLPMWLRNLLEGVVRIVIFMGYLMLCSHMKDIRRVFQYHGAEHKTIFCYEHGLPLTVENVRIQPRHHPRCGTSFLFVVIVVSILLSSVLFSFVEVTNTFARMGLHLLLLPVIVSLTYELNRVVGRYDNRLTRLVSAPGMWLQNWTTFEPDDSMIEVGIRAFTLVLPEEKGKDQW